MSPAISAKPYFVDTTARSSRRKLGSARAALWCTDVPESSLNRPSAAFRAKSPSTPVGAFAACRTPYSKQEEATEKSERPAKQESN
jgi:hypothetical protein